MAGSGPLSNGRGKLVLWLAGVIVALMMSAGTYWATRVQHLEDEMSARQKYIDQLTLQNEQRITRLEAQYNTIRESLNRIERHLDKGDTQ